MLSDCGDGMEYSNPLNPLKKNDSIIFECSQMSGT